MEELTLADIVRLAVGICAIILGALVIQDEQMADFMGATLIVVAVVYMIPLSRRKMIRWGNRLREILRRG
jgi:hypothetical protein